MTAKEKFYRLYMDFFETAERKRRWNIFEDIPWNKLSRHTNSEQRAIRIETYCAEEMYLPDYTTVGNQMLRGVFGLAWFQNAWSYEESLHGLVFREYLIRSGLRTQAQFEKFESDVFSRSCKAPFATRRQMTCYGALQESATYLAYRAQKDRADLERDQTPKFAFFLKFDLPLLCFFEKPKDQSFQPRFETLGRTLKADVAREGTTSCRRR